MRKLIAAIAAALSLVAAVVLAAPAQAAEVRYRSFVTGYSYYDNTPPGSPDISHPRIHKTAGGVGTWRDPITLAVGHKIEGGRDILQFPAGTRFYIPNLRRYF